MSDSSYAEKLESYLGKTVVLDTKTPLVYLGTLKQVDDFFIILEDADVHDMTESTNSKEYYTLEASKHGVQKNRHRVAVRAEHVVSFSLLQDVVLY